SQESLAVPSNIYLWLLDKSGVRITKEIELTHATSQWKDMEHIVFNYSNKGPQPGIGIIIRGKGQKENLPVIVKSYPASPLSKAIMHYGMLDWIVDVQKAIDRGYAVMFVDTPILPEYGEVGPAQDILWGISAAVQGAEKTGWIDRNR